MTLNEAKYVVEGMQVARCAVQPAGANCTCPLKLSAGGSRHYDEDVVQVVRRAIYDVQGETGQSREDAALQLLREGLNWNPPARQAYREVEWLSACYREVKYQVVREQEVAQ